MDGDFAPPGAENKAFHADNVTDIPFAVFCKRVGADIVGFDIDLHFAAFIDEIDEIGLAHITPGEDTSGNADVTAFKSVERVAYGFEIVRFVVFADDKRVLSVCAQLGELLAADAQDFARVFFGFGGGRRSFFCHMCNSFVFISPAGWTLFCDFDDGILQDADRRFDRNRVAFAGTDERLPERRIVRDFVGERVCFSRADDGKFLLGVVQYVVDAHLVADRNLVCF